MTARRPPRSAPPPAAAPDPDALDAWHRRIARTAAEADVRLLARPWVDAAETLHPVGARHRPPDGPVRLRPVRRLCGLRARIALLVPLPAPPAGHRPAAGDLHAALDEPLLLDAALAALRASGEPAGNALHRLRLRAELVACRLVPRPDGLTARCEILLTAES